MFVAKTGLDEIPLPKSNLIKATFTVFFDISFFNNVPFRINVKFAFELIS